MCWDDNRLQQWYLGSSKVSATDRSRTENTSPIWPPDGPRPRASRPHFAGCPPSGDSPAYDAGWIDDRRSAARPVASPLRLSDRAGGARCRSGSRHRIVGRQSVSVYVRAVLASIPAGVPSTGSWLPISKCEPNHHRTRPDQLVIRCQLLLPLVYIVKHDHRGRSRTNSGRRARQPGRY